MKARSIAWLLALALPVLAPAGAGAAPVAERVLANGLKVLVLEDHKSPLAVFEVWYRVGAMDERTGKTGLSHLLEHMMFKGTKEYDSKALSRTVMRNGGIDNAFTSKDVTAYWQVLPSDRIELSMRFESDRMRNLLLREPDVVAERAVVMEERRLRYEDDPQNALYEEVLAAAFKAHPYRTPVIGWMSDIAGIGQGDLRRHYETFYSPDNATIVVVGDVVTDEVLALVEKYFGAIPPAPPEVRAARHVADFVEPPQKGERRVRLVRDARLPYILSVFHAPTYPDADAYALDVLAGIMGSGRSSRLYASLVYERKLAQGVFAEFDGVSRNPSLFYLGGTASPGTSPEDLETALFAEAARLASEPPSAFELQKARNQIAASFVTGQDSIYEQARILGELETTGIGWREKESYLARIEAVTAEDVRRVAARYLREENRTVGVLIPRDEGDGAR